MNEPARTLEIRTGAANFGGCLLEGSAADRERGKKIQRRAIAISIALESAGLSLLVIAPMLARPAEIRMTSMVPIPPYRAAPAPHRAVERVTTDNRPPCVVCPAGRITPISKSHGDVQSVVEPPPDGLLTGTTSGRESLPMVDKRNQPEPPVEPPRQKKRIYEAHINPALLRYRVEPVFPPLARQIRKSGKVELHAVIANDGTIQSLEVIRGDAMFLESAIAAVSQWRYEPTLLNGQPVEVDTFITVIYTLNSE